MNTSSTNRTPITLSALTAAIILVASFSPTLAQASNWDAIWTQGGFEPEMGTEIAIDNNGNVYVAGWLWVASRGDNDMVAIKYDANGVKLWDYVYDGGLHNALGYDEPVGIGFDGSGNVYVSGKSRFQRSGSQDYDYVTIKLDPNGIHVWTRYYDYVGGSSPHGDDTATDMVVDLAGNVWVTGDSDGDYLTVKYDADGTEMWVNRYEGDSAGLNSMATAVAHGPLGNCFVTGYSQNPSTAAYDFVTIKYAPNGSDLWTSRYGNPNEHDFRPWDIAVDGTGNVAVTGRGFVGDLTDPSSDATTVKYASNGVQQWAKTFSGTGFGDNYHDEGVAVAFDANGNVFIAGSTTMESNARDFLTIKYSASGVQEWMRHHNEYPGQVGTGDSIDHANDIAVDGYGRVHVVGGVDVDWSGVSSQQTYGIVTYSNDGAVLGVEHYDQEPSLPWDDQALAVAVTASGDVAVTGSAFGSSTSEDIGTIVYYSDDGLFADGFESGDLSAWSAAVR